MGGTVAVSSASTLVVPEKKIIFDQNDSFWAKEILQANKPLEKNISADIAIIGGGYSGLSTAYHLKKYNPSLNVIILEAMHLGHGALGRHGGMILPQPPTESFEIAFDIDIHKTTYGLTTMNIKGIKNLLEEHRIDCDLKLDGFCHSIIDEEDIKYYQNYVAKANDAGIPIELWDAVKTQEKLGTNHYAASVYDPNGGSLHAVKFINALKLIAESLGVVIYENSEVTEIIEGKIIQLIVGKQASIVKTRNRVSQLMASTSKLGYFNSRILPVHAQSAVTVPLSPEQLENIGWKAGFHFMIQKITSTI